MSQYYRRWMWPYKRRGSLPAFREKDYLENRNKLKRKYENFQRSQGGRGGKMKAFPPNGLWSLREMISWKD
jgi:hypothetical protein